MVLERERDFAAAVRELPATENRGFYGLFFGEMMQRSYQTLARYLNTTRFFLECLDLAYVADRQTWRDKLLLPS